ncbi:hypothetical protein [Martelella soudanensis]|uniref:hypothetical protein n=1 Tax=Martelella sp. NC18 TaxID=2740297 RepID=UPI0015E0205E|nr:hypothetical protein [Martelella sp. NC18]
MSVLSSGEIAKRRLATHMATRHCTNEGDEITQRLRGLPNSDRLHSECCRSTSPFEGQNSVAQRKKPDIQRKQRQHPKTIRDEWPAGISVGETDFPRERNSGMKAPTAPVSAMNTNEARNRNLAAVFEAIREAGGVSRTEIGAHMPFSLQTVTSIGQELIAMGLIREGDRLQVNAKGKPQTTLHIVPNAVTPSACRCAGTRSPSASLTSTTPSSISSILPSAPSNHGNMWVK